MQQRRLLKSVVFSWSATSNLRLHYHSHADPSTCSTCPALLAWAEILIHPSDESCSLNEFATECFLDLMYSKFCEIVVRNPVQLMNSTSCLIQIEFGAEESKSTVVWAWFREMFATHLDRRDQWVVNIIDNFVALSAKTGRRKSWIRRKETLRCVASRQRRDFEVMNLCFCSLFC